MRARARRARGMTISVMTMAIALTLLVAACTSASTASTHPTAIPAADWAALEQRPLTLPTLAPGQLCPNKPGHAIGDDLGLVQGAGPVYAFWVLSSASGVMQSSVLQRVNWIVATSYRGPVLVRGRQLDGSGTLTFHGGLDQAGYHGDWRYAPDLPALRLLGGSAAGSGWTQYQTHVNVPGDGCYAYQVDGTGFSYTIIFFSEEVEY